MNVYPNFTLQKSFPFGNIYSHNSKNIAMVVYGIEVTIDLDEAKTIIEEVQGIVDLNQPIFGITLAQKGSTITESARHYFANNEFSQETTKAMAVIMNQLAHRLLFILYLKFNRPKSPIRIFKSLSKALSWLNVVEQNLIKEEVYS